MAWTLQYYADPGGAPTTYVEKVVGDGWTLSGGRFSRRSLHKSELTFVAEDQAFDTAPIFAYESKVVVYRDRNVSATGVFSGGTIYFQGWTTGIRRLGRPDSESVQYTFSDLWWAFSKLTFEQTIWNGYVTSHVLLNVDPTTGLKLTIKEQIEQILDYANAKLGGSAFTYDISNLPDQTAPSDEKRDVPCDEALKSELRWTASATSWVDHTATPPKIYFANRLGMGSTSVALGDGVTVVSQDIVPLYELVTPQVILRYEQTNRVGSLETFSVVEDKYPSTPDGGKNLGIMRGTINLQGLSASRQIAPLTTRLLDSTNPTTWASFWKEKHDWLNTVSGLSLHDPSFLDSSHGVIASPLPNEVLNDGTVHSWMTLSGGTPVTHQDALVFVLADYVDKYGNVVKDEELQVRVKLTNGVTGNYTRSNVTSYAEGVPTGLAKSFYDVLSILQFEGEIAVETAGGEVAATQFLGKKLNVTGGASEWAAMNALVTDVSEDIEAGRVTVRFGANRFVSPGDLVDLMRVTRTRRWSDYNTAATSGGVGQSDIIFPSATARENSGKGRKQVSKSVVGAFGTSPTTSVATMTQADVDNNAAMN